MEQPRFEQIDFPIIDSHIHLYASDHIKDLAWADGLPRNHILNQQNSVAEYRAASSSQPSLQGFIFVETDRKSSLSEDGWEHALDEIAFLKRIRDGTPLPHEGHIPEDRSLLLGAVPWAPLPADPDVFTKYLDEVAQLTKDLPTTTSLVKGFRYLFQDKPPGTQLNPNITTNLLILESRGYNTFDLGVDFHSHGSSQIQESITILRRFYGSTSHLGTLRIVINHLCKPDLSITGSHSDAKFEEWSRCIRALAAFPTTYMKLSGLFSELPESTSAPAMSEILDVIRPYTRVIFDCFGAQRIMFGSDWPVCSAGANAAGIGAGEAWKTWVDVVRAELEDVGCSEEEKRRVWGGTANEVYGA